MHDAHSLARCVGDVAEFLDEDWARRARVHRGADYSDLLALADVDHILATMALRAPAFRLVKGGTTLPRSSYLRSARVGSKPIDDLIDVGKVYAQFEQGATIVLQGLQRFWPPLSRFCRDLELALTHPVQANAYVTPPTAAGLRVHHDAHDVFALQTHGRKQWVLYEPGISEQAPPPQPAADLELASGDCLYLPRGTPHAARTLTDASVHITLGVRNLTWLDVLRAVVNSAGHSDVFDAPLPAGFANHPDAFADAVAPRLKEFADWMGDRDAADVARTAVRRFWSSRPPLLTGQLEQLLTLDEIDDASVLVRRPGATCLVELSDDEVQLVLGDRTLHLPQSLAPGLRWLVAQRRVRVRDLAPFLDEGSRVVLARRLVREGLLIRAPDPGRDAAGV